MHLIIVLNYWGKYFHFGNIWIRVAIRLWSASRTCQCKIITTTRWQEETTPLNYLGANKSRKDAGSCICNARTDSVVLSVLAQLPRSPRYCFSALYDMSIVHLTNVQINFIIACIPAQLPRLQRECCTTSSDLSLIHLTKLCCCMHSSSAARSQRECCTTLSDMSIIHLTNVRINFIVACIQAQLPR